MIFTALGIWMLGWANLQPQHEGIQRLITEIRAGQHGEVHGLLVSRAGRLITETYFDKNPALPALIGTPGGLHMIQSSTKSVNSLLVCIAMDRGLFTPDTTLAEIFADHYAIHDDLKAIPIRHLLSMRDGIDWKQWADLPRDQLDHVIQQEQPDYIAYALRKPAAHAPGTRFNYSDTAALLTAAAIRLRADQSVKEFARIHLFEPLGINEVHWLIKDQTGLAHTGAGLRLYARDFLKIGELVLGKGSYRGNRIIQEATLNQALQPHSENVFKKPNALMQGMGYGWFWWLRPHEGENLVLAMGRGEQSLLVSYKHRTVVVTTGWNEAREHRAQIIRFFRDHIVAKEAQDD
ncbi:serine hydrolase domain-containing protein [Acanthopleuribacter pedis]|uniref:Serine hydrolase n=1 Tax=Acanthopleuribacter pedis TaxID=442870 RepID=A0A8J7QIJ4_9BACT|nr:serine hydrolase [Acanthopleuribacter pedis]MBO1321386.1 serine hydrolase [Acanthopleuribacter pedis]